MSEAKKKGRKFKPMVNSLTGHMMTRYPWMWDDVRAKEQAKREPVQVGKVVAFQPQDK